MQLKLLTLNSLLLKKEEASLTIYDVHFPTIEEISQILANRFAAKCFTPLELTHLKDNFYSRALDQDGMKYWNEEILSQFLGIPDGGGPNAAGADDDVDDAHSLDAGPVLFRMVSYLGAFPFQNTLAPSVLTFEALVKVIVLLTDRYGRVLKRGRRDRLKLLFGSLADIARRTIEEELAESLNSNISDDAKDSSLHASGFTIDAPANDEDEEDDDDLALAALEALDAMDVFKHDQRIDRTVYEARVSVDTFQRLLVLLLAIAPLDPLEPVSAYTTNRDKSSLQAIQSTADTILKALNLEDAQEGIDYKSFLKLVTSSLPYLFDPLAPLFEHLLFSKNLRLSRKRGSQTSTKEISEERPTTPPPPSQSPSSYSSSSSPVILPGSFESSILTPALLSHLSFFLATSSPVHNIFRNNTRFYPVFSSTVHGESLTSFSHHVLTWHAPSLLLLTGSTTVPSSGDEQTITIGAYLPSPWKLHTHSSSSTSSSTTYSKTSASPTDPSNRPCLFQLSPTHTLLQGSPLSTSTLRPNMPVASFSTKTGISIGCIIPPTSRTSLGSSSELLHPKPTGGGSLMIDHALETATFIISDGLNGEGVFLPPGLSPTSLTSISPSVKNSTTQISIYSLEIWGVVPSPPPPPSPPATTVAVATNGVSPSSPLQPSAPGSPPQQQQPQQPQQQYQQQQDAISLQRAHWAFEAREAERRRNINMKVGGGGESEAQSGRALLEMAGIIGDSKYSHGHGH
ncbi:hypothetical protein AJ80_06061 [Polytolypa hystricis UAMH7299]|uniref:TLDc domain-containing protein n=1 Tax=Polytolypa hystricis (strain UAMH7299) TaxID=1447883 RepID=A0A2B7Y006_POLH7|nr:hypothetical protein AJ80_06061 [Polytolypa hystricis UAMH7299]